jgi:hypothetical protein
MSIIPTQNEYIENQNNHKKRYPSHPLSDLSNYILESKTFIESGTNFGDTVQRAIDCGYENIYTIEILEDLYKSFINHDRFKPYIESGVVIPYHGSSIDVLGEILNNIDEPVTFWLDGHLHGESMGVTNDSPIIEELNIIKNHKIKTHTILIDDIRIIKTNSWGRGELYGEVLKLLDEINPNYVITFEDGLEPNDVLIAKIK